LKIQACFARSVARLSKQMLQQPNLFSSELPTGSAEPEPQPLPKLQQPAPVWLQRLELFLRVAVRLYLGIFVLVLPWWPRFWDDNPLFHLLPPLGDFATHGAVRGVVSGFGLLNLWIAFHEAVHYRESGR
jgi:hypothetical protein